MADSKLTDLTAATTYATTDIMYLVVDPGGSPLSRKITFANLIGKIPSAPLPSSAAGFDFGSATLPWKDLWFAGTSGTPGTNNFQITGASTSGTRTITFPDASITVARIDAGQTFTGTQAFGAITASGTIVQTSASATAFESGPNGGTNPVIRLVNNVASQADGISIAGQAAQAGTIITALSSGSNSSIEIIPKGTGSLYISPAGTQGAPRLALDVTNSGFYGLSSGTILVSTIAGADKAATHATNLQIVSNMQFAWGANTSDPTGSPDTGWGRTSAGIIKATNGSTSGGAVEIAGNGVANGQNLLINALTESLTLSTSGATTDTAIQLPANSIILSVTARITTSIAGVDSTALQIGDATVATRFGSTATLTAGTTIVGLNHLQGSVAADNAGPVQTSAASVRVTLAGGGDNTPSGGVVRIAIHFITLTAATS